MEKKDGKVVAKVVNIPDLDELFSKIADTFNKQQEYYLAMGECTRQLKGSYHCTPSHSLAACLQEMKQEHRGFNIKVQMQGYNFSLGVQPTVIPDKLEQAQQQVKQLCSATKLVVAIDTKLQEMINAILQNEDNVVERVKAENMSYQDQVRIESNLQGNFQEVKRAKQLSCCYSKEANALLEEVAQLAGVPL
nr:PREDICTED: uncharacterized protein LOC106703692 [Latimeria chalumnae]|eukprot:XP_014344511.1 PREDICTED: uncharacterized protein LOC106703692 [Latimeria chalumnae]